VAAPRPAGLLALVLPLLAATGLVIVARSPLPMFAEPDLAEPHVRHVQPPADLPDTYAEALARAELDLANAEARAARHPDEWAVLESLAGRQASHARLTGAFEDYAAAQATLDRAFALASPGAGPHLIQAELHLSMHRLAAAGHDLDLIDAYAVPPDIEERAEIAAMRGDIAFYRGDYAGALALYSKAEAMGAGAATDVRRAIYDSKTGRLDRAARYLDHAVEVSRMPTPQFRARVELQKGSLLLERGRWDEALARFRRADAIFPGYWLIEEHIAETQALRGEFVEAERMYSDIVRRTNNPEFMDALARLARSRGDAAAADRWSTAAAKGWARRLELFPEAAYGHALGHFMQSGDTARALDVARRNAAARPFGDAKVMLAQALLDAGQPQAARAVIEEVLRSPWRTAQTHAVAAEAFAALGDARRAAVQHALALRMDSHEFDDPKAPLASFN
jgi:tetratricopeptide (TPR) repeat protein